MASNGSYKVTGTTYRQTAQLDANGRIFTATLVSFSVGTDGPFTLMFSPGQATPDTVAAAIRATVNEIKQRDALIAQLNQEG